jgi:hypothetical protein
MIIHPPLDLCVTLRVCWFFSLLVLFQKLFTFHYSLFTVVWRSVIHYSLFVIHCSVAQRYSLFTLRYSLHSGAALFTFHYSLFTVVWRSVIHFSLFVIHCSVAQRYSLFTLRYSLHSGAALFTFHYSLFTVIIICSTFVCVFKQNNYKNMLYAITLVYSSTCLLIDLSYYIFILILIHSNHFI